jgi:hypothetical protein
VDIINNSGFPVVVTVQDVRFCLPSGVLNVQEAKSKKFAQVQLGAEKLTGTALITGTAVYKIAGDVQSYYK